MPKRLDCQSPTAIRGHILCGREPALRTCTSWGGRRSRRSLAVERRGLEANPAVPLLFKRPGELIAFTGELPGGTRAEASIFQTAGDVYCGVGYDKQIVASQS